MKKIDLEKTKQLDNLTRRLSRIQKVLYEMQQAIYEGSERDVLLSSGMTLTEALNCAEANLDCISQDFCLWIPEDVEYTVADWLVQ